MKELKTRDTLPSDLTWTLRFQSDYTPKSTLKLSSNFAVEFAILLEGKLSFTFIDSVTFSDLLQRLSKKLPLGIQLPVEPKNNEMEFYYRSARVAPVITTNSSLVLHIHLPLVFTARKFKLTYKYIAVDEVQMNHLLLTDADLRECHDTTEAPICNPSVPVQRSGDTCAFAVLMSNAEDVVRLCPPYMRFLSRIPPPPSCLTEL
ncbi:hypothetical protein FOCC_FOCC004190, partial [Frankliniella occidentalis]